MITLLALSILVILHELGHFVAAKFFGVRVEEFGLGLPPKAWTLAKKGETEYTLNWLPLGGFVRLYGEQGELSRLEELNPLTRSRALSYKPWWQRAIILMGGIIVNLFVGIIIFGVIYTLVGIPRQVGKQVVITEVVEGSPASLANLTMGDVVTQVGNEAVFESDQFVDLVSKNRGKAISIYVKQLAYDGTTIDETKIVQVVPRENPPVGEGSLGVVVSNVAIINYEKKSWYEAPFYGAYEGVKESYLWSREIALGIVSLFSNLLQGQVPQGLAGPVGVVKAGGEAADSGLMVYFRFIAIISINLGIFNLFPLPALDGGRLLFLVLEKVVGKKRVSKIEGIVHGVGFLLLIGVLVLVTWMDIKKSL